MRGHGARPQRDEERAAGARVELLFNGDFNWFDIDPADFAEINETVLEHAALAGNVELELHSASDDNGCGCNYPEYVDAAVVERSNAIMQRLRQCARGFPRWVERIAALPMKGAVEVGGVRIGVVHGDAESVAGWGFAVEAMPPAGDGAPRIAEWFRAAKVAAFACTHTCLPFVQDFDVDGERRVVVNNGAAGMPNFAGDTRGLLTRISALPGVPRESLYGTTLGALRIDALPIAHDQPAWVERFLRNWPEGSAANVGYFERIRGGPRFGVAQAMRLGCP